MLILVVPRSFALFLTHQTIQHDMAYPDVARWPYCVVLLRAHTNIRAHMCKDSNGALYSSMKGKKHITKAKTMNKIPMQP